MQQGGPRCLDFIVTNQSAKVTASGVCRTDAASTSSSRRRCATAICGEASALAIRREHPDVVERLTEADRRMVAHAVRNNETDVVRLMLECGWPVDARGQHQGTPLHWAAFHGNDEMARAILRLGPPLEITDADFHGMPLDWAVHGSEHGWYSSSGNHAATVEALLKAGAMVSDIAKGTKPVREMLRRYGAKDQTG